MAWLEEATLLEFLSYKLEKSIVRYEKFYTIVAVTKIELIVMSKANDVAQRESREPRNKSNNSRT